MKSRHNALRGAVAALEGCLLLQKNPESPVHNANRYYCAEMRSLPYYSWLCVMHSANSFGSKCHARTHDYIAWKSTEKGNRVTNGELREPLFLLGEGVFTAKRRMIVLGENDKFSFEQSILRINIECAFGEFILSRGILWYSLE